MTNILFVCSAGISTSMMIKKMQEVAAEKKVEAEIWAVGNVDIVNNVEKMDVMLLRPQVRFLKSKIKVITGGKPVTVIGMRTYGTMNGAEVLKRTLKPPGV